MTAMTEMLATPAVPRFTIEADSTEIDAALSELDLYVDRFPAEALSLLSEVAESSMKLFSVESPVTVGALAVYPIKPTQWLLDLLAACRAGNFDWIIHNQSRD